MSAQTDQLLQELLDLWTQWRRQSSEPLASPRNLAKVGGVIAALYGYQRFTPLNVMDKPLVGLAAMGALAGLALPARDQLLEQRDAFSRSVARQSLQMSPDEQRAVTAWFTALDEKRQCAVAQLFRDEPISDVARFLTPEQNRQRLDDLFSMLLAPQSDAPETTPRNTIDVSARLAQAGLGAMIGAALFKEGANCVVKTTQIEVQTKQGLVVIPTNRIVELHFTPRFLGVDARARTVDGSKFSGKLLTRFLEISYTGDVQLSRGRVDCKSLSSIVGV